MTSVLSHLLVLFLPTPLAANLIAKSTFKTNADQRQFDRLSEANVINKAKGQEKRLASIWDDSTVSG